MNVELKELETRNLKLEFLFSSFIFRVSSFDYTIRIIYIFLMALSLTMCAISAQEVSQRYALLIGGLGGTPEHKERFQDYLSQARKAFIETFGFAEANVFVLAGSPANEGDFASEISNAQAISTQFQQLSESVTENDDVYILLFGHGSYNGKNAVLNIPRRDLKDIDYAALVNKLNARRIVFINTASCSGPFIKQLSGLNRIIITATKTGRQRTDTYFPKFLIAAFQTEAADLNKDSRLSVLEVFKYAAQSTAKQYADGNHLATEHALLDDSGDAKGVMETKIDESNEGRLASTTYFTKAAVSLAANSANPTIARLLTEKQKVEEKIRDVQAAKSSYSEASYFSKLEPLFIRLAIINDELESNSN